MQNNHAWMEIASAVESAAFARSSAASLFHKLWVFGGKVCGPGLVGLEERRDCTVR